jgi:mannose-6-phosphate isomerase-like protein (cupin superfamily)
MAETKYGKYIIKEPLEKGRSAASLHICGEEGCFGSIFPNFPAEVQLLYIDQAFTMIPKPHAHDVDELFFIFSGNPSNLHEFDAEIEIYMGEEGEKHIINTTSIVYVPKGVVHCPAIIKKVNKPFMWMHVLFEGQYDLSSGDISLHPAHSSRQPYTPEEAAKLRSGILL